MNNFVTMLLSNFRLNFLLWYPLPSFTFHMYQHSGKEINQSFLNLLFYDVLATYCFIIRLEPFILHVLVLLGYF